MAAFFASLSLVVLAEIGDKTQLLAMAFGARYGMYRVVIGTLLATIVNNCCAVAVGRFLSAVIPLEIVSFAAALSFIGFGLWMLKAEAIESGDKKESRFGPIATVAITFFLLEMGDKTQLATVSLAVQYKDSLRVFLGATLGMVIADFAGITAGLVLMKNIPEKTVKWVSAGIFIAVGFISSYKSLAAWFGLPLVSLVLALLAAATVFLAARMAGAGDERLSARK